MSATVSTQRRVITGEELASNPEIDRCELVEGKVVPMSPTGDEHGAIEGNIYDALKAYVRRHGAGRVRVGEVGIYTARDPDTVRAADVLFISNEQYARRSPDKAFLDVAPELVVEVLSPRDSVMDMADKLREYFGIGVKRVWVVDPRARSVYVFRSPTDVREVRPGETLSGDDALPGFETPVAAFFED